MRFSKQLVACAGVLAVVAAYAATSGPEAGAGAPMVHIDAVNDDGGAFCVTCKAGMSPAVVAFITRHDEASQKLIAAINEAAKVNAEKRLNAAIVFVGAEDTFAAVAEWAKGKEYKVPLARLAPGANELRTWNLNPEVQSTTVFVRQHKVHASVADIDPTKIAETVGHIVG